MIFVVLPAYNESQSLRNLLPSVMHSAKAFPGPCELIVVNDGSRDDTSDLLKNFGAAMRVTEIKHERNQGYGAALRSGYRYVLSHAEAADSIVVSLDADGTHGPEFIPRLIDKIRAGCDMVTASYAMPGGSLHGVPAYRAWLSRIVNRLFQLSCPIPGARTYSNGFRAYRVDILKRVAQRFGETLIDETGFAGGSELFLKAAACGGRAGEVPFDHHYERRGKESKIRFIPTIRGYLKLMWRARRGFRPTLS